MILRVNDEPIEVPAEEIPTEGLSVAALLARVGLSDAVVAVAVDGAFVPRGEHPRTRLAEGSAIEIVAPMQGG